MPPYRVIGYRYPDRISRIATISGVLSEDCMPTLDRLHNRRIHRAPLSCPAGSTGRTCSKIFARGQVRRGAAGEYHAAAALSPDSTVIFLLLGSRWHSTSRVSSGYPGIPFPSTRKSVPLATIKVSSPAVPGAAATTAEKAETRVQTGPATALLPLPWADHEFAPNRVTRPEPALEMLTLGSP